MPDTIASESATHATSRWAAYLACFWAMLFALMSFYWAAGGTFGVNTLGRTIQALAHDPGFIAIVWLTGIAKVVGGLFALTLARSWATWLPAGWKATLAWLGGIGLTLYGGVQLLVEGLVLAGVVHVNGPIDWQGMRWHVWLWDPWWLLGGIFYLLAAWQYQRSRGQKRQNAHPVVEEAPTLTSL